MIHALTHRPYHASITALRYALEADGIALSAGPALRKEASVVLKWGYRYDYLLPTLRRWCEVHDVRLINGGRDTVPLEPPDREARLMVIGDAVHSCRIRESPGQRWKRCQPEVKWEHAARQAVRAADAQFGEVSVDPATALARGIAFSRRGLTGKGVPRAVARYLAAQVRPRPPDERHTRTVAVVTGLTPDHPRIASLVSGLEQAGHVCRVVRSTPVDADAAVLWGLGWRHLRRESLRAELLGIQAVQSQAHRLWEQRAVLHKAGLRIPRARLITTDRARRRLVAEVAPPVRWTEDADPGELAAARVAQSADDIPAPTQPMVVEEAFFGSSLPMTCWVAGGRVLASAPPATREERHQAEQAARALGLTVAAVQLIRVTDGGPLVWRVLHRNLADLPDGTWSRVRNALVVAAGQLAADPGPRVRTLRILVPRALGATPTSRRVWHIHALMRGLRRAGHEIHVDPNGVPDGPFDLVLQDPAEALGRRIHSDTLNAELYRQWRRRGHLIRDPRRRALANKLHMPQLVARLRLRAPRTMQIQHVRAADLPVIVKPVAGSLGVGIRRVDTLDKLPNRRRHVAQQFIDSKTGYAVSIRVVTVREEIVSAALFYRRGTRSNLSQGANAIALAGPGARSRLTMREVWLLKKVGIDPSRRVVPVDVAKMAARIGRFYAARGVQMVGHDYVVDSNATWWFIEVNLAFGMRVFNVTHGCGTPAARGSMRVAGDVLAEGLLRSLQGTERDEPPRDYNPADLQRPRMIRRSRP